ncbi:hypothetical protein TRICI_003637 [Trichomonascus ciferrii]|uniref:SH3 domain-containing protein n=1 Tax=Trichomonascus ciferrii TaxID=44093 RepID=A0A642V362_9ASCO|nr:hypothetical protein TRICI_003637 [Trichomonascus ciferrii]
MAQEVDDYSFANNFWGKDDSGVHTLFQRMNDSKQTLDEIQAFVKERIAIEDEYARKLQALSRRGLGTNEIGSLKEALDVIKTTTENMGKSHSDASQQFREQLGNPLEQFAAQSRSKRKAVHATVDKFGKAKLTQTAAVEKARQRFEMDCNKINGYSAQQNLLMGKELERNNAKLERAQQSVDASKREYQNGLRVLAENTDRWNKEWKHSCDQFQDMEEERIDFLKSNLWNYTNIISAVCVSDDEGCESIRVSLEKCDIDKDIEQFVRAKATGAEIYNPPEFINYLDGEGNDSKRGPGYQLANFRRETTLDYEDNSEPPPPPVSKEPDMPPQQERQSREESSMPPATQAPPIRKPVLGAPADDMNHQPRPTSASPSRKPVPNQAPTPQQQQQRSSIPQLNFNDDEDDDYQSIPVLAHPDSHPSTAQSSPVQGSASPNSSVYSNNTSISSQSEDQNAEEPKRRTWASPFRRRSKKDLNAQKSWGSIGRNNSESSSGGGDRTVTAKSGIGKRFVEQQQQQKTGQNGSSVLSMGENMFDLGVSRPQGSKSPFENRSRTGSPTKNMSKDDPLVAALARLKDSMPDEDRAASPQPNKHSRYGSVGGYNQQGGPDMGPKRVSSRSAPVSPVKGGQARPQSALVPPGPAFTASEMEATSGRYSNQTKELFGGGSGSNRSMQRPKSQVDMRQGGRRGYEDAYYDDYQDEDDSHGYYNTMPARPKSFYAEPAAAEDPYGAPPPPPQQQPPPQGRADSYRRHYRSKSASPLKGGGGSVMDPYRSASPIPQQGRGGDSFRRAASPGPDPYRRTASPGPDPYRSASPRPHQHDSFRRSRSPGPGQGPSNQSSRKDPYRRSPSPAPHQLQDSSYPRSVSPGPGGEPQPNYYRSASPAQQYHPRESMRQRSKSAADLSQSNSQMKHSMSLPAVSSDGRKIIRYSKAAYDYRAAIPEEVSFRKGDILLVLLMQEDGWWEVEVLNSRRRFGLAPSNFLVNF